MCVSNITGNSNVNCALYISHPPTEKMTGTLVNAAAIAAGGCVGLLLKKGVKGSHQDSINKALGVAVLVLGLNGVISSMFTVNADGTLASSGELLLIDAGVEVNSLYTADITRTFPTNGKFTDFQKKLYQAVLDSQQAGFEAAKPGATYSDIHHACMRVIAERLHDWGILPVDVEESLSPEGQQHRRWLACGVAHHLGLDVHDCAQARYESYQNAKIRPGMIFTIEPGLYFREDDLLIPPEYRGIGIRIEDDVLMTEDGPEWISAGIPKQIDDVEAWMADMAAEGVKA